MANPKLRILLVDEEHSRLLSIEKNLSGLGYSRVAPLTSLRDLLAILDNALSTFDLLIIHQAVLDNAGEVLEHSVRSSSAIKHLLVYQGNTLQVLSSVEFSPSPMRLSLPCPPDRESIRQVMGFIDSVDSHEVYGKTRVSV
ncbi:histidine kinase [Pseudomonas sp. TH34]|uniref:histidine kinase n=1 Tax=Pseudomonas sp. TH34 TaxID=2796399 RepID=UPI0019122CCF|nr:histidine kinase [Pseudomonas sp. TH34]MBK5408861.1 histidine kinase [Pseudomonas sp. TH34]